MCAVTDVILFALQIYLYILFAAVIVSWLYAFNIVNQQNQFVGMIANALYGLTEPVLRPIRRLLPDLGGIDISPIGVILAIFLIRSTILRYSGCYFV